MRLPWIKGGQVSLIFTDFLFFKTLLCKFQRAGGADGYCIDTFNCQRMALQRKHEIHKEEHRTPNTELRTQNKRRGKTASLYNGAKLRVWYKKKVNRRERRERREEISRCKIRS